MPVSVIVADFAEGETTGAFVFVRVSETSAQSSTSIRGIHTSMHLVYDIA